MISIRRFLLKFPQILFHLVPCFEEIRGNSTWIRFLFESLFA